MVHLFRQIAVDMSDKKVIRAEKKKRKIAALMSLVQSRDEGVVDDPKTALSEHERVSLHY